LAEVIKTLGLDYTTVKFDKIVKCVYNNFYAKKANCNGTN